MLWLAMLGGAAVGAVLGGISTREREKQDKAVIRHQKEQAWQSYLYGKEHGDTQYGINKREAHYQLGEQTKALNQNMDLFADQYNTSLLAQAYATQDARIQTAGATGMSLAAEGASGTRGNEANEAIRAYATQGLERNIDIQNQQNAHTLKGTMQDANRTVTAINHERASWAPGGYRHELKESQDNYNLNMAELGQQDFDKRFEWATPTKLDYVTSIFGGASSGMNIGYGMWDMGRNLNSKSSPWQTPF